MTTQGYTHPDLLVDTEWLESHLDSPNVRLVDCDQYDAYFRAHIGNSVGIRVHHYIKQPGYSADPKAHPLVMPPEPFTELMESMGIGDETQVVAYDSNGSLNAARFWWVLTYYGHTNVKVLNGGWKKWFDEGKPTSIGRPPEADVTFTPRANAEILCTLQDGVAAVGSQNTVFLDVRTDAEWDGANDRGNRRAGHVPGAVHLEWVNFLETDQYRTFKPAAELRAMLGSVGATPDKNVVAY